MHLKKPKSKRNSNISKTYEYEPDAYSWLNKQYIDDDFNNCDVDSNNSDEGAYKQTNAALSKTKLLEEVKYNNGSGKFEVLADKFGSHSLSRRSEQFGSGLKIVTHQQNECVLGIITDKLSSFMQNPFEENVVLLCLIDKVMSQNLNISFKNCDRINYVRHSILNHF